MPNADQPVVEMKPGPVDVSLAKQQASRYGEPMPIREVMRRLGFRRPDSVYALLVSKQLAGHRVAPNGGSRPRWKVFPADVDDYLDRTRNTSPTPPPQPPPPAGRTTHASRPPVKQFIDRSRRIG